MRPLKIRHILVTEFQLQQLKNLCNKNKSVVVVSVQKYISYCLYLSYFFLSNFYFTTIKSKIYSIYQNYIQDTFLYQYTLQIKYDKYTICCTKKNYK